MRLFAQVAGLLVLLLCPAIALARLPSEVNVQLFSAHPGIHHLRLEGPAELIRPAHRQFPAGTYEVSVQQGEMRLSQGSKIVLRTRRMTWQAPPQGLRLVPDTSGNDDAGRIYPGQITISAGKKNTLLLINRVPTPQYVGLVVASETPAGWPVEALKAQGILTQTRLARQPEQPLKDTTEQEAYLGLTHRRTEADTAVQAVWGQVLTDQGHPISAYYHSTCAGGTSDGSYFTGKSSPPYLKPITCKACQASPFYKTTRTRIPRQDFELAFGASPQMTARDSSGRPRQLRLSGGKTISGYGFWLKLGQRFGWDKAPGTRFSLNSEKDWMVIESTGAGHGVGMCQWGAAGLARQGKSAEQILQYYFPGTRLGRN